MAATKSNNRKRKPIAEQLKDAIRGSGKTVYQLSQASGVSQGVLSRFLGGSRDIKLDTAERICAVLGLDLL